MCLVLVERVLRGAGVRGGGFRQQQEEEEEEEEDVEEALVVPWQLWVR